MSISGESVLLKSLLSDVKLSNDRKDHDEEHTNELHLMSKIYLATAKVARWHYRGLKVSIRIIQS